MLARAAALASLLLVAIAPPPPIPKYICVSGGCVEDKLRGLPLAECQLGCGGAPAQNYTCQGDQCVNGSSGVPKAECEQICVAPPGPPPSGGKTIVDLAVAMPTLSTLVTALKAGGLVGTLSGPGPFTVFAPTNAAFEALNRTGALSILLEPQNKAKLVDILTFHVVPGKYDYRIGHGGKDLPFPPGGGSLRTIEGENITVKVCSHACGRGGRNTCKNFCLDTGNKKPVGINVAAVNASNGLVFIVDTVLQPKVPNIVEIAQATPDLSTLVTALQAGDLVGTLSGQGPPGSGGFTVFAPTNEAFAALPAGVLSGLLKNNTVLDNVLTYHVVPRAVFLADLQDGEKLQTVEGKLLTVRLGERGDIFINRVKITTPSDVAAANGVVHIVDGVLLPDLAPPAPPPPGPGPQGCKTSGCFFSYTNQARQNGDRCGEVNAALRMPADIWNDPKAVAAYVQATVELFRPTNGPFRSNIVQAPCDHNPLRWVRYGSQMISWTNSEFGADVCQRRCGCGGNSGVKCKDTPDQPSLGKFCSLCGPKYNQPIAVTFWYPKPR